MTEGLGLAPRGMKPAFQCALADWNRGFIPLPLARGRQSAVLAVPA